MKQLSRKEQIFVEEYLVDLNGANAYVRAGYSARRAKQGAHLMLRRPHVAEAVQLGLENRVKRLNISSDEVLRELARVAFGDPRKLMSWGPGGIVLKSSAELTDDEAALVSEVAETTTKEGGTLRLKTNDKLKALELIGRHLKMFTDKHELSGSIEVDLAERVRRAKERAGEQD